MKNEEAMETVIHRGQARSVAVEREEALKICLAGLPWGPSG